MESQFPMRIIAEYQFKEYENRSKEDIEDILNVADGAQKKIIIDDITARLKENGQRYGSSN
ncbi:hypothetical protein [Fulvivirga kasyanovii]|uniref:Uncharacterized protein n=1 Tax=Fulvivirga kasyanovii TaxID=396812 RepID=A0ABW9RN50_9BACT|nr:hypothetical protein [Fulvivirga kasyanovii]MTI24360.1 hypothetical protein [Fulvivirga kasyanovii]